MNENNWQTIKTQVGSFGKHRNEIFKQYDELYGKDNWKIAWVYKNDYLDFPKVCKVYEQAYYIDSFNREGLWNELRKTAADVYDTNESNIKSGLDYLIQEDIATHMQDISIRNVLLRRGWEFNGSELVQIRSVNKYFFARSLCPGIVRFHEPEYVIKPVLKGWWTPGSVEEFYQSNKILQVRQ